jgi:hypothetical protein
MGDVAGKWYIFLTLEPCAFLAFAGRFCEFRNLEDRDAFAQTT